MTVTRGQRKEIGELDKRLGVRGSADATAKFSENLAELPIVNSYSLLTKMQP